MVKKIKPRWGAEQVSEVIEVEFPQETLDRVFEMLSIKDTQERDALQGQFEELAARYVRWKANDEDGPSVAEQNAALTELSKASNRLLTVVQLLDHASESRLQNELVLLGERDLFGDKFLIDLKGNVHKLAKAAENTFGSRKPKAGPKVKSSLYYFVAQLAEIYEQCKGEPITHTPREKTHYDGTPHSPAGRFVIAIVKSVDPKLPNTTISGAIAKMVKARKVEIPKDTPEK